MVVSLINAAPSDRITLFEEILIEHGVEETTASLIAKSLGDIVSPALDEGEYTLFFDEDALSDLVESGQFPHLHEARTQAYNDGYHDGFREGQQKQESPVDDSYDSLFDEDDPTDSY